MSMFKKDKIEIVEIYIAFLCLGVVALSAISYIAILIFN